MKIEKSILGGFVLMIIIAALYRVMPGRPFGFAPQIAMALFSGSIVRNKKYSFLLPILSMLVSDVIYEILFRLDVTTLAGFYKGQLLNYILFAAVTLIGFMIKKDQVFSIAAGSVIGATFYFILSNYMVWVGGGLGLNDLPYSKTWDGLIECMTAGVPFYKMSLYATLFFNALLFGGFYLLNRYVIRSKVFA